MKKIGFICFGEINTPISKIQEKHDQAINLLTNLDIEILDAGIVIDDAEYNTADNAIEKLINFDMDCIIICIAGWIPTHAVIRVTDHFRHIPVLLWGLCGWKEGEKIITTADQAGTTALRFAFDAMDYRFKFVYNVIGEAEPIEKISTFIDAAYTVKQLRKARIGTMGYRDMLLYGTQFEGNSLRGKFGVEVEPFEMLEIVQNTEKLNDEKIEAGIQYIKNNWVFKQSCDNDVLRKGVMYALAIGKKIEERKYEAVSLIDVDGMKKLLEFPPAMVFMLLEHYYNVLTIPENDIMGSVTQLIMKYITGQVIPYFEYYEFFKESMLVGVPDYIPIAITDGDVTVLPTAFGLLPPSLVNISRPKTGYVTCARLIYKKGRYFMHAYTGTAKKSMPWEEYGWDSPAPQLPSLEIFPDSCTVEEFAQKVSGQHVIIAYGNYLDAIKDLCDLLDIELI